MVSISTVPKKQHGNIFPSRADHGSRESEASRGPKSATRKDPASFAFIAPSKR